MTDIDVTELHDNTYRVELRDPLSSSSHLVTAAPEDVTALAGSAPAAEVIAESFRFLLDREPKEAILHRFDLPSIAKYFPDYPNEIRRRLDSSQ